MWILMIGAGCVILIVGIMWYVYAGQYWLDYRKAKRDIIPFVESYKKRCTEVNRFVVTVESLQDSFREYNTETIKKVWLDLIEMKLIERDPTDGEWCIR